MQVLQFRLLTNQREVDLLITTLFIRLLDGLNPIFVHLGDAWSAFINSLHVVWSTITTILGISGFLPQVFVTLIGLGLFVCVANIVLKVI